MTRNISAITDIYMPCSSGGSKRITSLEDVRIAPPSHYRSINMDDADDKTLIMMSRIESSLLPAAEALGHCELIKTRIYESVHDNVMP